MQASDTTKQKKEIQLKVTGMSCTGCSNRCQRSLLDLNGIRKADVSYEKGAATIEYNPDSISEAQIIQRISEIGFKAKKINEHE
jgi:copper chaperone CopZ